MEPSHLAALYNAAPIILWVEDLVTSVYLQTLWRHDRRFQLYVGGGHEVLSAVVENARRMQLSHVYCLRDRRGSTSTFERKHGGSPGGWHAARCSRTCVRRDRRGSPRTRSEVRWHRERTRSESCSTTTG